MQNNGGQGKGDLGTLVELKRTELTTKAMQSTTLTS